MRSLAASELGYAGAITRVMHYGDSAIGNDGIPGAIRLKMQARFGDAGHGFHLLGQPNASYRHQGVRFEREERRGTTASSSSAAARRTGTTGSAGRPSSRSAARRSELGTASEGGDGAQGRRTSRCGTPGLPRGGNLKPAASTTQEPVECSRPRRSKLEDRWYEVDAEDGEHTLTVRAAGGGKVRAYGVVMERVGARGGVGRDEPDRRADAADEQF
jgi:hypothetical protein